MDSDAPPFGWRPVGPPAGDPFEGTPYRVVERLGGGTMGEVFLVEHRALGRPFVIKLIHRKLTHDAQLIERVRVEAQAPARLAHPNIVSVAGFGRVKDGRPFIVMERLVGQTLAQELSVRGKLSPDEAIDIVLAILSALEAAHAIGIVHRDIKPDNVFLHTPPQAPGSAPRRVVKLLDFGVARVMPGAAPEAPMPLSVPTDSGVVIGTPEFISPEGARGQRVDHRADLYSTGLCLYEMVAGRGPFGHVQSAQQMLTVQMAVAPERPSRFAPGLPRLLDEIVMKALAKDRKERFQTAGEFREALEELRAVIKGPAAYQDTGYADPEAFRGQVRAPEPSPRGSPVPVADAPNKNRSLRAPPLAPRTLPTAPPPEASPRLPPFRALVLGSLVFIAVALIAGLLAAGLVLAVSRLGAP